MSRPRVLISGASIAGPSAAYWLARAGWAVTVVEQSGELRATGQNVDVRATGREVLTRMGLEQAVRDRSTGEIGTRFVDESGDSVAEFGVREGDGDGPTAELEILRGDLATLLVDACADDVEWWCGHRIVALDQREEAVAVTLQSGREAMYDLVVIADGVRSTTRDLAFPTGVEVRPIGMTMAFGTIEPTAADDQWWRWFNAPGSRQAHLRPDSHGTTRAMLSYLTTDEGDASGRVGDGLAGLELTEQRARLRERFADVGWETPRILDGFDADDGLYVDDLAQVRAETWHDGRVCLLGDAGWCVTPIGGGGTSVALVGAYVLSAFVSQVDGPAVRPGVGRGLARYEEWMRPLVDDAQDLPPGVPWVAAPESRVGVAAFRFATKVAASAPVQALAGRFTSGPEAARELPGLRERPHDG